MWIKGELLGVDWTVWTPIDVVLRKKRVAEHTPSSVVCFPKWTPRNWWKNHFRQRDLIKEEAWLSIAAEDSMDEYLMDCAVARLEKDTGR